MGAIQSVNCAYVVGWGCTGAGSGAQTCTSQAYDTCAVVDGTAQCAGSGAPCDPSTTPTTCDGTAIVSCSAGRMARFDCAEYSGGVQTCTANGGGKFGCGDAGTQCSSSTPESCDGSVLGYCWFGNVATLDCKDYGLSGCATTTQNGSTWAHCTP